MAERKQRKLMCSTRMSRRKALASQRRPVGCSASRAYFQRSAGKKEAQQQAAPQKPSWWQQLKQAILGKQEHVLTAAAIIETPMRVQPDQMYTIRMHIIGRNEPELPSEAKRGSRPAGLSALVYGDTVSIEVRSVLQQSYAY